MDTDVVYATSTCTTADPATGLLVRLHEGETWDARDPFVSARPELFSSEPTRIRRTTAPRPIETATKNPGERKRTTGAK
jgi:hypothetical protein